MNKELAQKFTNQAHSYCIKQAENCGECEGSGQINTFKDGPRHGYYGDAMRIFPCPHCQPWRDMAGKYCWHEEIDVPEEGHNKCRIKCTCGLTDVWIVGYRPAYLDEHFINPTYTHVEDIVSVLRDLGLWERFVVKLFKLILNSLLECCIHESQKDSDWIFGCAIFILARILTTPSLLLEAAINFMEGEG